MKVCTDACLFGAIAANEILTYNAQQILDIGTGTGLLSLMLAQKNEAFIDTVEIDHGAYKEAAANIALSPWKENISVYNADIISFNSNKKYDFIISNPPFFEADLKSDDNKKNAAKHDSTLTLTVLLDQINRLLSNEGSFALLLPFHRSEFIEVAAAASSFYLTKKILVQQTPTHHYFRSIVIFSRNKMDFEEMILSIKNETGNYSDAFVALLKDYYLHL
jgi:tRNA1Val (adenine37-N6)-methyltransferase